MKETAWSAGRGGARTVEMAQKQKAVYFKVIDAIFFMTSFLIQSAGPWQLILENGLNKHHESLPKCAVLMFPPPVH